MSELTVGFILGILVMSCVATIGAILIEYSNDAGLLLLGPAMWLFFIVSIICTLITNLVRAKKMYLFNFEELRKTNGYYGRLFGDFHMLRCYGSKKHHPILYHLIIIRKIKIIDKPKKMY